MSDRFVDLKLPLSQVQYILNTLAKQPYVEVAPMMGDIVNQVNDQAPKPDLEVVEAAEGQ